jgi:hypothetical protein
MKSLDLGGFAATRYEEKDGTLIVSVAGEVDLSSAPQLAKVIWKARGQAASGRFSYSRDGGSKQSCVHRHGGA